MGLAGDMQNRRQAVALPQICKGLVDKEVSDELGLYAEVLHYEGHRAHHTG